MRVFLTGFMGAGKSTVGRALALLLEVPFRDLDAEVETAVGRSIPEIFADDGEEGFRRQEVETLDRLLERNDLIDVVIATGGGTITRDGAAERMRHAGTLVWLDVPVAVIEARLDGEARRQRPLFQDPAAARRLYEARREDYARADLHLEIAADEPASAVAERLARCLVGRPELETAQ